MHRFQLGEQVGRGAMADVYRAYDELLGRHVAVKLFRLEPDEVTRQRIDHEAQALARLSHPGLVSIYGTGELDGRPFLVMELVTGPSLAARLARGPLSAEQTRQVGTALAAALEHAHTNGVVHRDVKPSNVLLDENGAPHLGDFGVALVADAARLTLTDEIIGTPAYLSPEQVLGNDVGPSADVYALGLVLLECMTGIVEYADGGRMEAALVRLNRPPRIPADTPQPLADTIAAMTAYDPRQRPLAGDVAARLADTSPVGGAGTARHDANHRPTARMPVLRSRAIRPAIVGALALVGLATGLVLSFNGPEPTAGSQLVTPPSATQPAAPTRTGPTTPLNGVIDEPGDDNPQGGRDGSDNQGPGPAPALAPPGQGPGHDNGHHRGGNGNH